jgi:hypothetical protein
MNKIVVVFAMLLMSIGINAQDWKYANPNWKLSNNRYSVSTEFMQSDDMDKICFMVHKDGTISLGILNYVKPHKAEHKLVLFANKDDDTVIVSFRKVNYTETAGYTWYDAYVSNGVKEIVNSRNLTYVDDPKDFFIALFAGLKYIDIFIPETDNGDKSIRLTMYNDTDEFYYTAKQMFK